MLEHQGFTRFESAHHRAPVPCVRRAGEREIGERVVYIVIKLFCRSCCARVYSPDTAHEASPDLHGSLHGLTVAFRPSQRCALTPSELALEVRERCMSTETRERGFESPSKATQTFDPPGSKSPERSLPASQSEREGLNRAPTVRQREWWRFVVFILRGVGTIIKIVYLGTLDELTRPPSGRAGTGPPATGRGGERETYC